jgi:hypothetical protein
MTTDRREFVQRVALGAATLTGLTSFPSDIASALGMPQSASSAETWDTSWTKKLTGKHKAVFDVPEVESALGVWRSQFWPSQVKDAFPDTKPTDTSIVLVLRHNAIALAMQQSYWDKYGAGKTHHATHPLTQQSTERNPALLSSARGEIDKQFDDLALDKAISRGTIVLACNLALQFYAVPAIARVDGVTPEEAAKRARTYLLPGITVQPSGVFAALLAQEAGCKYVRAS